MKAIFKGLLLLVFISGISETAMAQRKYRKRAKAAIKELKEGVLIVSIPTYQKKIDTLTSRLENEMDEKERQWFQKELQLTREKRDIAFHTMTTAFETFYDYFLQTGSVFQTFFLFKKTIIIEPQLQSLYCFLSLLEGVAIFKNGSI